MAIGGGGGYDGRAFHAPDTPAMTLDDLDTRILDALREDGRMSVTEIAQRVDATAATVRKRMRRMEREHGLRVVAMTDYYAAGFEILLAVGIEVEGQSAAQVGRALAAFPEVFCVNQVTGNCDLELLVGARDHEELHRFLHEEVAGVQGVARLLPAFAVDVLKYESDWTPRLAAGRS
jgi:Lrp/AsnC family transcriptional regulator for asnA, asnC and gidA